MADAEQLAGDLGQAGAERQVVALECARDDLGAVDAFGHHDGGDRIRVPLRRRGAQFEPPALEHRGAHAAGEVGVPREDVLQAFLGDDGSDSLRPYIIGSEGVYGK